MAVDEVTQFAIDHHELMRRPDYLGKMDSERQVRALVEFIQSSIQRERDKARVEVDSANAQRKQAEAKLRLVRKEVRGAVSVLSKKEFEPLIFRQSKDNRALLRAIGLKTVHKKRVY